MDIGMLWYDDSPIGLKERVDRAADYYLEKHGRQPNLCFVHPDMLKTEEGKAKGVVIRKGKGIMPGHFWIGVDESQVKKNGNGKAPKAKSAGAAQAITATPKTAVKPVSAKAVAAKPKVKAKSGSAKAATKKAVPAKPKAKAKSPSAKPKSSSAKPKKRERALLKKNSGSRVKVTNKTKSKAKS